MISLGKKISSVTAPGMIIALDGGLAAGKTTLTKGIAEGLGIKKTVTSPSFTIINEYHDGRIPLYHMDLYRLDNLEEFYLLGADELLYGNGLSIIEWSEKAGDLLPEDIIRIVIEIKSGGERIVELTGFEL